MHNKNRYQLFATVIFLLPFLGAVYALVGKTMEDIAFTQKEQQGMELHQALFMLQNSLLQERRRLVFADYEVNLDPLSSSLIEENIAPAAGGEFNTIVEIPELQAQAALVQAWMDREIYQTFPRSNAAWRGVYQAIKIYGQVSAPSAPQVAELSQILDQLQQVMREVGVESNLILDPQVETYFMMEMLVNRIPEITNYVGYLRMQIPKISAHASSRVHTDETELLHEVLIYQGRQQELESGYVYNLSVLEKNDPEQVSAKVENKVQALVHLHRFQQAIMTAIEQPEQAASLQELVRLGDETVTRFNLAYRFYSAHLAWHLEERRQTLSFDRWIAILGAAFAFSTTALVFLVAQRNLLRREEFSAVKKAEERARISEERLMLAVEGTNEGIWDWMDISRDEEWWSPQFKKLLGYEDHELMPSFSEFASRLHPDDAARVEQEVEAHFRDNVPFDTEYRLRIRSGEYRWFRARGTTVRDAEGRPLRMVGSLSDISERKLNEHKLQESYQKLEWQQFELAKAKAAAEQATRLKSEFLANMSHEIRTPMNGIIGMTHLLLEAPLDERERKYAETVMSSAEALLQIINDILDFSKIEAGKIDLEHIPFNLKTVCTEVLEMMAIKAAQQGIALEMQYAEEVARHVVGDSGRVRQILLNLVSNALKFTEKGYVRLLVNSKEAGPNDVAFYVEVEDTGIGIPEDKTDYIFNKFSQADSSTSRKFGGTGLGLSICKELTRMMRGEIGVRSRLGVGSTFWFRMVLGKDLNPPHLSETDQNETPRTFVGKMRCLQAQILLAEDNPVNQLVATTLLKKYGCSVTTASDGEQALQLFMQYRYDLVFMDCQMPVMDGYEATQAIRRYEEEQGIPAATPVIAFTAHAMKGDDVKCKAAGMDGYISKPIHPSELERILHQWLPPHKYVLCVDGDGKSGET